MTTNLNEKINVYNPAASLSPVGVELKDILDSKGVNVCVFNEKLSLKKDLESISKLTKKELDKIEQFLGIESISNYLEAYQEDYKVKKKKAEDSYKEYLSIYRKFSHVIGLTLSKFNTGIDKLNDFADFLGVNDESEIEKIIDTRASLYKITGSGVDNVALFVWKRRGEELFKELNLPDYNKEALQDWVDSREWANHVLDADYFKKLPLKFSKMGIGLILEPFFPKTVYGYVDWITNKPLIQISDRGKNLAVCWYTLFHEIGHVLLHQNHQIFEGDLNFNKTKQNKIEQEANEFAFRYLFNGDCLRKHIFANKQFFRSITEQQISDIACQFRTSNVFVAFWLHKAGLGNYITAKYIPKIEFIAHV